MYENYIHNKNMYKKEWNIKLKLMITYEHKKLKNEIWQYLRKYYEQTENTHLLTTATKPWRAANFTSALLLTNEDHTAQH